MDIVVCYCHLSIVLMERQQITVFDFDGTLTVKDTLFEFIRHAKGQWAVFIGIICCSPFLLACLLRLYPNGKAKEKLFSYFFKGMPYQQFCQLGQDFCIRIKDIERGSLVSRLQRCVSEGQKVYVVSASIKEWVRPWCERQGVKNVLTTEVEVADGLLTGRFSIPNCYGQEKVHRFLSEEPQRETYELCVYGDSAGDDALMAIADHCVRV